MSLQTRPNKLVCSTALALCAAGLALSDPSQLRATEQATNPTTGTYGSGKNYKTTVERQSEGELSAEDLHQASLLSSQLLTHLNAAATHCIDGKGDSAKPEIEKAQSLAGIVRKLLPTTTVTTVVKDAQGKEVYRDVQKVQEDQIPIFSGEIAVEVVEPLVEAKKDQAALKGLKLADADIIHTAMLGAKANLQAAKLRLEAYRGLLGTGDTKKAITMSCVSICRIATCKTST